MILLKKSFSIIDFVTKTDPRGGGGKKHKFPKILFSHFPIFLPTRQNSNHNDQRQTTFIKSWHQNHPIFHIKLKNMGKKKKKNTPVNVIWYLDPSLQKSSTLRPGMHHWRPSSYFPVQPEIYWTHYTSTSAVAALWKTLYPFIGN
jgi:hypothetical protein